MAKIVVNEKDKDMLTYKRKKILPKDMKIYVKFLKNPFMFLSCRRTQFIIETSC